jgi:rare lipoprotein A
MLVSAVVLLCGMGWDDAEDRHAVPVSVALHGNPDSDVVVLALPNVEPSAIANIETLSADVIGLQSRYPETCSAETTAVLSFVELPLANGASPPLPIAPQTAHDMLDTMGIALASSSTDGVDLVSYARRKELPGFSAVYRAVLKRVAVMGLPRIQDEAAIIRATVVGTVSTYNPYRDGNEGGAQTASGELYDPSAWTAAIKADLRNQFGGVRYGKFYRAAFALIESGNKQLIVKINDVGPLKPGRVLDLNERSMRHFDPFLTRGLIEDVKITLLPGEDWTPGPVGSAYAIDFNGWQTDSEMARLHALLPANPYPPMGVDVRAEMTPSEGG